MKEKALCCMEKNLNLQKFSNFESNIEIEYDRIF